MEAAANLFSGQSDIVSLLLLLVIFAGFVGERYPPSIVAFTGAAVFLALGFVSTDQALQAFSNSAAITIAAMFVVSAALVRTGALEAVATQILNIADKRPKLAVAILLGGVGVASSISNSTTIVVVLIPIVIALAVNIGVPRQKLLIPLSYVAILGGMCTLIGTTTNLLVDSVARQHGHPGFGIFDITPVGLISAATGVVFLALFAPRLLPGSPQSADEETEVKPDIVTEVRPATKSEDIGKRLAMIDWLKPRGVRLISLWRNGERVDLDDKSLTLEPRDRLILRVTAEELMTLADRKSIDLGIEARPLPRSSEHDTVRITIASGSHDEGLRLTLSHFLSRFALKVLGARRRRNQAGPDLASLIVRAGDQFWLRGDQATIAALSDDHSIIVSGQPPAKAFRRNKAVISILALAGVVFLAAIGVLPIAGLALIAAGIVLFFRCLDASDAWEAVDGNVLVLIFSMLIIGKGLEETGAVERIIAMVEPGLMFLPPLLLIMAIYALTSLLTEIVTNAAVAVIMTPIVLTLSQRLETDATPLLVAVMFGASASFATPIGYQTNTLVYAAGSYRFSEFLRIGIPMNIAVGVVASIAIALWF